MSTLWESFAPKTQEVVPVSSGWLLNPTWLLTGLPLMGGAWHTACFLCLSVACYLTVFRLVRWNRSTRHRLEENLDRLVTMKQFSELTDQHQRVRTQMNHQVHMYGLLDEEVDRLRDDAKTLLKTVASAERALLPERLRLRDLQDEQQQQQLVRQRLRQGQVQCQAQVQGQVQGQAQAQAQVQGVAAQQQQQQPRRRRPAPLQRLRPRPHATCSAPTSLPAGRMEPAPPSAPTAASATATGASDSQPPAAAD